jgi:hypothetical protein
MAFGFEIYGPDAAIQFDSSSLALYLQYAFDSTGVTPYNHVFHMGLGLSYFGVIQPDLPQNDDFRFNTVFKANVYSSYNGVTQEMTVSGTPSFTNIGLVVPSFSSHVNNTKFRINIYGY